MVSCTDKTTNACVHELYYIHLQHPILQSVCSKSVYLNNHSGIQLSTVVFHILLRRSPLQKRVILRKIGGYVVFADSQSGSFRTVISQSILCIMHYAIPQSINSRKYTRTFMKNSELPLHADIKQCRISLLCVQCRCSLKLAMLMTVMA